MTAAGGQAPDAGKLKLKEAVIVEGRDDVSAVLRAAEALVIATHGYGIRQETLDLIAKAYHTQGIIIFTDPDRAGENIRRRLTELFPFARQAFLDRADAEKDGDIGIENAGPEAIQAALEAAREPVAETAMVHRDPIGMEDLDRLGLAGGPGAMERRAAVGKVLGIGTGNAKAMLRKLNGFGITREELWDAAEKANL